MRARRKELTVPVAQWDGTNKREIDSIAGTRSRRVGDALVNENWIGSHRMSLTDWIVTLEVGFPGPVTDADFNELFEVVA